MTRFYLLFDRVHIHAANAIPGPLSYGFPALNGFLGAIHALQRRLPADFPLQLNGGVLIACHHHTVQTYHNGYYSTFIQSRNPLLKSGETASIIEEGKIHLTISLAVAAEGEHLPVLQQKDTLLQTLHTALFSQRVAGGSITHITATELYESHETAQLKAALYPAYILMDAGAALPEITKELQSGLYADGTPTGYPPQPQATTLDALLATAQFQHIPPQSHQTEHSQTETVERPTEWQTQPAIQGRGWLMPLPVGYQAISPQYPAGILANSRNPNYPAQYVGTVYSLGRWVFPNRLPDELSHCFWQYDHAAVKDNLYLIHQP